MKSMPNNSGSIVGQELGLIAQHLNIWKLYMITLVTSCSWISTAQSVGDLIGLIVGQEFLKYYRPTLNTLYRNISSPIDRAYEIKVQLVEMD